MNVVAYIFSNEYKHIVFIKFVQEKDETYAIFMGRNFQTQQIVIEPEFQLCSGSLNG